MRIEYELYHISATQIRKPRGDRGCTDAANSCVGTGYGLAQREKTFAAALPFSWKPRRIS